MMVSAINARSGMLVDLEGDKYADPNHDNRFFQDELQYVAFSRVETPLCVVIGFEGWDWCGFPPDHRLNVKRIIKTDFGLEF